MRDALGNISASRHGYSCQSTTTDVWRLRQYIRHPISQCSSSSRCGICWVSRCLSVYIVLPSITYSPANMALRWGIDPVQRMRNPFRRLVSPCHQPPKGMAHPLPGVDSLVCVQCYHFSSFSLQPHPNLQITLVALYRTKGLMALWITHLMWKTFHG